MKTIPLSEPGLGKLFHAPEKGGPANVWTKINALRNGFTVARQIFGSLSAEYAQARSKDPAASKTVCIIDDVIGGQRYLFLSNDGDSLRDGRYPILWLWDGATNELSFSAGFPLLFGKKPETLTLGAAMRDAVIAPKDGAAFMKEFVRAFKARRHRFDVRLPIAAEHGGAVLTDFALVAAGSQVQNSQTFVGLAWAQGVVVPKGESKENNDPTASPQFEGFGAAGTLGAVIEKAAKTWTAKAGENGLRFFITDDTVLPESAGRERTGGNAGAGPDGETSGDAVLPSFFLLEPVDRGTGIAGWLVARYAHPAHPTQRDRALLSSLGEIVGMAATLSAASSAAEEKKNAAESAEAREIRALNRAVEREVTRKKKLEEELDAAHKRENALLNHLPDMMWLKDTQGRYTAVNEAFARFYGRTTESIVANTDYDFLSSDQAETNTKSDEIVISSKATDRFEMQAADVYGETLWLETINTPLLDDNGEAVGTVGSARDITKRKRAEEALERSEARFRTLTETTNAAILIFRKGKIRYVNNAASAILGYSREELAAMTSLCDVIESEDCHELIDRLLVSAETNTEAVHRELLFRRADGRNVWLETTFGPVEYDDRSAVLMTAFDVTARKNAERLILEMNISLEERIAARTAELERVNDTLRSEILERKRVLDALQTATMQLNSLIEQLHLGVMHVDEEGCVRKVNPAFCALFALPSDRITGKSFETFVDEAEEMFGQRSLITEFIRDVHEAAKPVSDESVILPDGRIVQLTCIPFGRDGVNKGALWQWLDATEQRKAEKELLKANIKFKAVFNAFPDMFFLHDYDGVILDYYTGPKTGLMQPAADLTGTNLGSVLNEEFAARLPEAVNQIRHTGGIATVEYVVRSEDGERHVFEARLIPFHENQVICIVRNITTLRNAERMLRESQQRINSILASITDVVYSIGLPKGEMNYISPAAETLYGHSISSFSRNPRLLYESIVPEDKRLYDQAKQNLISSGTMNAEYRIRHEDGSIRWINERAKLLHDGGGIPEYIEGIITDISERKSAEEDVLNALAKEKELNELKTKFISTTSHEFRTPLTAILSSTEMLNDYGDRWPVEKKTLHLNRIQDAVKELVMLLDDILVIGRAEAGKQKFQPEETDIAALCAELVNESIVTGIDADRIQCRFGEDCGFMLLDKDLFRMIIKNLISNACKYSSPDSPIEVVLEPSGNEMVLSVHDRGIGIPEEDRSHIFEDFHRAGNVSTIQGTGLGLSIVRRAVEMHGGSIRFETVMNEGTVFIASFPKRSSPASDIHDDNSGH